MPSEPIWVHIFMETKELKKHLIQGMIEFIAWKMAIGADLTEDELRLWKQHSGKGSCSNGCICKRCGTEFMVLEKDEVLQQKIDDLEKENERLREAIRSIKNAMRKANWRWLKW